MVVRPLDTLLAIKVLSLVPGLNANAWRVATVLLEHFNRRTGQCDPGLDRIAGLLGISERTVIRCNHSIERSGLFQRIRHGGNGNRNSYEPVWSRFEQYETAWRQKFSKDAKARSTKASPACRQSRHVVGDTLVNQTYRTNLPKLTCTSGLAKKRISAGAGLPRLTVTAGKRSADAARDEAERRWLLELDQRYRSQPVTYGEVIEAITPDIQAAATDAELARHGEGIAYIIKQLRIG